MTPYLKLIGYLLIGKNHQRYISAELAKVISLDRHIGVFVEDDNMHNIDTQPKGTLTADDVICEPAYVKAVAEDADLPVAEEPNEWDTAFARLQVAQMQNDNLVEMFSERAAAEVSRRQQQNSIRRSVKLAVPLVPIADFPSDISIVMRDAPTVAYPIGDRMVEISAWPVGKCIDVLGMSQNELLIETGIVDPTDTAQFHQIKAVLLKDLTTGEYVIERYDHNPVDEVWLPSAIDMEFEAVLTVRNCVLRVLGNRRTGLMSSSSTSTDQHEVVGFWITGFRHNLNRLDK